MRNRGYDPALGCFVSRDPAGYVDGMSLYRYVCSNPLRYWDPFGLCRTILGNIQKAIYDNTLGLALDGTLLGNNIELGLGTIDEAAGAVVDGTADLGAYTIDAAQRSALSGNATPGGILGTIASDYVSSNLNAGTARATQLNGGTPSSLQIARSTIGEVTGFNSLVDGVLGLKDGVDIYGNNVSITQATSQLSLGVSGLAGTGAGVAGAGRLAGTARRANIARNPANTGFRYVGTGEAAATRGSGLVPNFTYRGEPKNVFYTRDAPLTSARQAQGLYQLPTTPTHRVTIDIRNAKPDYAGNVRGGSGIEELTKQKLPALKVEELNK